MSQQNPTTRFGRILHGGDYNPEQWPRGVWAEDMRLMDMAHVNATTIGVFSWVSLEPEEGVFQFDWLDDVMDMLHRHGKLAVLATPSAAMPAWFAEKYPEARRTGPDRVRKLHNNRVNHCWTSPVFRAATKAMAHRLAERYKDHPALAMWHVSNEYGGECYCDLCESAFREWLKVKFDDDLDKLNAAYWTKFWSHTYTDWSQIHAPGLPYGETAIHGLDLDWKRFTSDQTVSFFLNESEPIRKLTPDVPVTTNMMGTYPGIDYWKLAPHVDIISWDSYPGFTDGPLSVADWIGVAFSHDLNRTLKKQPFMLIECTPSSSNWYNVMQLKRPGMHRMEGLQAIAHGSDAVMYFQWRQSRGSQEKFHGGVVQHDGSSQARVFREVADLGETLANLGSIVGATVTADVALVYDWENAWAVEGACGPKLGGMGYKGAILDHYRPFWECGVPVDIIDSDQAFKPYRLVVAPMLYMLKPGVADRIAQFVESGGVFVATYWTGVADENDLALLGGWPGDLRHVFGVRSEEIDPLFEGHTVRLRAKEGNSLGLSGAFHAHGLCQLLTTDGAETLAEYTSEFYAHTPCLTRNLFGEGEAFFVASRNEQSLTNQFLKLLLKRIGIKPVLKAELPDGVTAQQRTNGQEDFIFVINCNAEPQTVIVGERENLTEFDGARVGETLVLEPYAVKLLVRSLGLNPSTKSVTVQ